MSSQTKRGFTLMELLIVVIIIGVLAAIAVPQYQKAVLKSRYSALMPIAKSLANGNEVYYMEHGEYASAAESSDVSGQDEKYPDGTDVDVVDTDKYSYVLATRDNNFPLNYIVYQKHSTNFPDNIHCEASTPMAEEVCQGLGGQLLESGSLHDGYTTYILTGSASDGQMPTSLSKLVAACEKNANCTVSEQGDNTTLQECEGDLTGTNIKTCTNVTYDEDGEQVGYEKNQVQCRQSLLYRGQYTNNTYGSPTRVGDNVCIIKTYDENDTEIGYVATTGHCAPNSICGVNKNGLLISQMASSMCLSSSNNFCTEFAEGNVITYVPAPNGDYYTQKLERNCLSFKMNGTCENYGGTGNFYEYTGPNGAGIKKSCSTLNSDGTCAVYSAKSSIFPDRELLCSVEQGNIDTTTGECL